MNETIKSSVCSHIAEEDAATAKAFASSWNNLPAGSVYTREQVDDWIAPLTLGDIQGQRVLEMGCGNASLMVHVAAMRPEYILGIDLGDSVDSAIDNMSLSSSGANWEIKQADLTTFKAEEAFDVVYCIGVLHHLKSPELGFASVVNNTKSNGRFHCWVYAREGNTLVRWFVDPIRRFSSKLPWRINKYFIAAPLAAPYFFYAKLVSILPERLCCALPLGAYSRWISKRGFRFFWHVAFDQLVTPHTVYISKGEIEKWLTKRDDISESYIIMRNGNSWKFGGKKIGCVNEVP